MLQWNEHKKRGEVFTWKKLDGWRTIKWSLTGGAIGGAIGFTIHRSRLQKESKQPFTSDKYLNSILAEENLKSDKTLFRKILIE